MSLFSNSPELMSAVWKRKAAKLVAIDYYGSVVQQGFWFSSHEQWKYVFAPYRALQLHQTLFANGEMARTHFSASKSIPGLFASCGNVTHDPNVAPDYLSASGIQFLASQEVNSTYTVTPYGAWALILANRSCGLQWYRNMLRGTGMSGPFGSTEATSVDGRFLAPLITWDTKITTVLSSLGGVAHLSRAYLNSTGQFDAFMTLVESNYAPTFPKLSLSNIGFHSPTSQLPTLRMQTQMCKRE